VTADAYDPPLKEMLDENPNPTEADVKEALSGVICRCRNSAQQRVTG